MRKIILHTCFLLLSLYSFSQNIVRMEFYVNNDPGFGNAAPVNGFIPSADITSFSFDLDVTSATSGLNTAYVRAQDANGNWSLSNKITFIKCSMSNMKKLEYFFNTDPGFGNGNQINLSPTINVNSQTITLDVSSAPPGFNTLFVRGQDSIGGWSITNSFNFIRQRGTFPLNMQTVEYFFDVDPGFGMGTPVAVSPASDIANYSFDADVTTLAIGSHNLFLRTKSVGGDWSLSNIISFNKTPSTIGVAELKQVGLTVYPNPSTDRFTLEASDHSNIEKIEVIDSKAEVVLSITHPARKQVIDLSDKSAGNYFIRVKKTDGSVVYQRIIKE